MNVKGVGVQRFTSMAQLGEMIGRERKRQGITQEAAAGLCGVSVHFLSNLERGKETSEFSKVLQVLKGMSIRLFVSTPADRV